MLRLSYDKIYDYIIVLKNFSLIIWIFFGKQILLCFVMLLVVDLKDWDFLNKEGPFLLRKNLFLPVKLYYGGIFINILLTYNFIYSFRL